MIHPIVQNKASSPTPNPGKQTTPKLNTQQQKQSPTTKETMTQNPKPETETRVIQKNRIIQTRT